MFSENNKISIRQTKYMLLLEWIARLCILLPVCLAGKTMGSLIFCILIGTAVWYFISGVILSWMKPGEDFFDALKHTAGTGAAVICGFAGLLFFVVQAAVFLNLCADLAAVYLLPEVPVPVLCLLPMAAAVFLSAGSIEVRGRFCEVVGPVVIALLILLIFLAAFGMESYAYEETAVQLSDNLQAGSFEVFACLGGMFLPLFGVHLTEETKPENTGRKRTKKMAAMDCVRAVKRTGLAAAAIGGSLCAVTIGSYGRGGMAELDFPSIRVMSNVRVPGGFLQRWDILFLSLLLVCLAVTVAGSLWYVNEILSKIWCFAAEIRAIGKSTAGSGNTERVDANSPDGAAPGAVSAKERLWKNRVTVSWCICLILIYFAAAGFLSAWTAICYYRALNLQLLVPVMFFFYIVMSFQRKRKQRMTSGSARQTFPEHRKAVWIPSRGLVLVLLLLASVLLLSGCTAYEPEERLFPMALEIGTDDGDVVITYAWDENAGPGSMAAAGTGAEPETGSGTEKPGTKSGTDPGGPEEPAETTEGLTVFRGSTLDEVMQKTTGFSERYMDYSHVKAIILDEHLKNAPQLEKDIVEWLAGEPAFASGLIVYPLQESGLTLEMVQERSGGQVGRYLENLYEHNEMYREKSTTLGRVIAEYYA